MKYHSIDRSRLPIAIVQINPIDPSDEEFDLYFQELSQLISEMKKGVLIHILSDAKFLPSDKRIKIGNVLKDPTGEMKKNLAGMAYVNSAFIPATILKGIFLVNPPPVPYSIVSSLEEALKWARQQMSK